MQLLFKDNELSLVSFFKNKNYNCISKKKVAWDADFVELHIRTFLHIYDIYFRVNRRKKKH